MFHKNSVSLVVETESISLYVAVAVSMFPLCRSKAPPMSVDCSPVVG